MPYKDPQVRLQKARERGKLWRLNNRERAKAKLKRWRARHPEKRKEYYEAHKDSELKRQKQRIAANPEKRREQVRKHYLKKRDYYLRKYRERRARLLKATVNPVSIELFIAGVRAKTTVKCYYCDKNTPGKTAHFDHIIPLSKGGAHSVENLCVACPHCNWSKNDTLIEDWFRLGQQILSL